MDVKCIKKSTLQQLHALVDFMEENPEFARGMPVFGSTKQSTEDQWNKLTSKLNSLGPPLRTMSDWKKTWADLKSRTKKKLSENARSMQGTGGGMYSVHCLSEMELKIDRILFLSKAAAPSGKVFGFEPPKTTESIEVIDTCFQLLTDTPPRRDKIVAVITPTRMSDRSQSVERNVASPLQQQRSQQPHTIQQQHCQLQEQRSQQPHTSQRAHTSHQVHTIQQQHCQLQEQRSQQPHTSQHPHSNQLTHTSQEKRQLEVTIQDCSSAKKKKKQRRTNFPYTSPAKGD